MNQKIFQVNNLHFYFRILFNDNKLFNLSFSENKNDLIKFLLNLNIVLSNEENTDNNRKEIKENKSEKKVGRNEKCPCGSGKKFKYCHGNI